MKIGILGYGNLSRGLEKAIAKANDAELVVVFTRRDPASVKIATQGVKVEHTDALGAYEDKLDVLMLCGGSATDLPEQGPAMLERFNTVDSFDTHAKIPEYLAKMDETGKRSGHLGIVSVGWDPGLFSLARLYFASMLPDGDVATFWGKGVSQGHSDAIRRIQGVKRAVQYTIPKEDALARVRRGDMNLTARDKHLRECFVVCADGADTAEIERTIVAMPNYFADYDTVVHFIDEETFVSNHGAMPHGGKVIRTGETSDGARQLLELSIRLDSNPEFTSSVLLSYARAAVRLRGEGRTGAMTVYDVAPSYLYPGDIRTAIKQML